MTPVTPAEAARRLNELALAAENENYHTDAAALWEVEELVKELSEPATIIVSTEFVGIETFLVCP